MGKRDNDISANDLLAKLKANMEMPEDNGPLDNDSASGKKYRFRRSTKEESISSDEEKALSEDEKLFVSPVPESDIEDLDIDALMKKYLSDDEYNMLSKRSAEQDEHEDELVRTLNSIEAISAELSLPSDPDGLSDYDGLTAALELDDEEYPEDAEELDDEEIVEENVKYAAPDRALFSHLSAGGKVCDVPEDENTVTDDDTKAAELRPISETMPFLYKDIISSSNEDEDEVYLGEALTSVIESPKQPSADEDGEDELKADLDNTVVFDSDLPEPSCDEEESAYSEDEDAPEEEGDLEDEDTFEDEAVAAVSEEDLAEQSDGENPYALAEYHEQELEDGEVDEVDANLMIAFGMDEELDKAIGKEKADQMRSSNDEMVPEDSEKKNKQKDKKPELIKEFISPAESKDVLDNYKSEYGKSAIRLFAVIAIVIVLFFYENITALGGKLGDYLNPTYYPVVNVMVGLQLLFIGFAVMYKSFIKGVRGLLDRKPVPESFLPILLLVSTVYAICVCFFIPGTSFVTFFFPASLSLLLSSLCERLDLQREIMTFNIISSKRTKFALEKLDIDDAELETKAFNGFIPEQPSIFKINKTSFIDGYFRRTKTYPSIKLIVGAFIPISLALTAIGLLIGFITFKNWQDAVMLGYAVFSFAMPATVFLAFALPCYKAEKIAYDDKSAFVGESALDEYTTATSISFDDREVFPTGGVKLRSVKVFGSGRIDTVIYNVASVYSILGGPLSDVLNVATADLGHSDNAEILAIDNEGVEAVVDGNRIYAGKADYIRRKGYLPVSDPDDEEVEGEGDISIMFLVCEDEVVAKLYIRYRIDPGFEVTLKRLYKSGICVGIKTVDPNINDAMLSTKIKLTKYPVRVLKYTDISNTKHGMERTDSGIVSKKSAKALLSAFTLCDKVKHVTKSNLVVNIITMLVGTIIAIAVAFLGSVVGIHSIYLALFQMFWLIPVYLMSRFLL